jgi:hypothetical protein
MKDKNLSSLVTSSISSNADSKTATLFKQKLKLTQKLLLSNQLSLKLIREKKLKTLKTGLQVLEMLSQLSILKINNQRIAMVPLPKHPNQLSLKQIREKKLKTLRTGLQVLVMPFQPSTVKIRFQHQALEL